MDYWWDKQELISMKAENKLNEQPLDDQNIVDLKEPFPRVQCL